MDCKDELTKCPLLSMKNLKDDELEHEYEQPLLCLKLYLDKFESNTLIFAIVAQMPLLALLTVALLHESTSIIMPKKVIFGIFYLALVTFAMFKQISLLKAQRDRNFKYLIEEGDIENRAIRPPSKEIVIDYSPSKQSRYCGLYYIFIHGWQAFASCLITWAHYLVYLFLIISLCNVNEENVKDVCPQGEHGAFYFGVLVGFIGGIIQVLLTSIQLTPHCDKAELKLLRNVNTETHQLVLCRKRLEIKKSERIDSIDVLVFIKKRCNARKNKLHEEYQQTDDVKEASIDAIDSDQTQINEQNMQFEASNHINKTVEEELRVLRSKYSDLQACFDDLKMKYDLIAPHFDLSLNIKTKKVQELIFGSIFLSTSHSYAFDRMTFISW